MIAARSSTLQRREVSQFLRFAAVGAIGFGVDDGVLLMCVRIFHSNPVGSRFVSFAIAVACTYQLNRVWAFRGSTASGFLKGLALYLSVQGLGFLFNLAAYSFLILAAPAPWNDPTFCLAVASALAMVVNYFGSSRVVFRDRRA